MMCKADVSASFVPTVEKHTQSVDPEGGEKKNVLHIIVLIKNSRGIWVAQLANATDFGSGHDLTVCEFEPRVGLCADISESEACFRFCVSPSMPPLLTLCVSQS